MSLALLFTDELKGYYKSKVMIILWIGMPALTLLIRLLFSLDPETENLEIPPNVRCHYSSGLR